MDLAKFRNTELTVRVKEISLPELKGILFEEGEAPLLTIRGLTSNEIFLAKEQQQKNSPLHLLAQAAGEGNTDGVKEVFKRIFGQSEDATAAEYMYRFQLVLCGCIDATTQKVIFTHEDVARIAEHWPVVFMKISTEISNLSGEGPEVKKK